MPKIVDHQLRKREISQVATDLFIDRGYSGTGMRDIATALSISKTQLYHYFPNKEVLFDFCFEQFLETAKGFALDMDIEDPLEEKLKTLVAYYASVTTMFTKELCLMVDYLRHLRLDDDQKRQDPLIKRHQQGMIRALSETLQLNRKQTLAVQNQLLGAMLYHYYSGQKLNQKQLVETLVLLVKSAG